MAVEGVEELRLSEGVYGDVLDIVCSFFKKELSRRGRDLINGDDDWYLVGDITAACTSSISRALNSQNKLMTTMLTSRPPIGRGSAPW